jgi:GT2 family glycosyltransferase
MAAASQHMTGHDPKFPRVPTRAESQDEPPSHEANAPAADSQLAREIGHPAGLLEERTARLEEARALYDNLSAKQRDVSLQREEALLRSIEEMTESRLQLERELRVTLQALAERDRQAAVMNEEADVVSEWLGLLIYGFETLLGGNRWRLGNGLVSTFGKLARLPSVPPFVEQIRSTLGSMRQWIETRTRVTPAPIAISNSSIANHNQAKRRKSESEWIESHYDVIILANIDWRERYQRPQQMAMQFARHGHRVFYVVASEVLPSSDPVGFRIVEVAANVHEVRLSGPRQVDRYASVLGQEHSESFIRGIEALRDQRGIVDASVIVHLPFWTRFALDIRERWQWKIVYDCMDEWSGFPLMGDAQAEAEKDLVEASDLVTVTARLLLKKWQPLNDSCLLVRNGVEHDFFSQHCRPNLKLEGIQRPIIGYYGAIAEWVDLDLLRSLAEQHPEWSIVLVGDVFVNDLHTLDSLDNVHLMGRKPYDDMPLYLYHFDVCVIPFLLNEVTHSVDPVKFYEFMSAGKAVVAVPLAELEIYREYLYFAETPAEFAHQIEAALEENDISLAERRRELAAGNQWTDRYAMVHRAIISVHQRVSIVVVSYKNVELTQLCVESILANTTHPNYEIIIVDNGSGDGTANYLRYIQGQHESTKVILNPDNKGFATANNQGLAVADGDVLVLLNNDTVVPRGWLAPLLRHLSDTKVGLVGPVTNFAGNEARIEVPYGRVADMPRFAESYMREHEGDCFDIEVLAMFCVAMRRETFDTVGPLDEDFKIGMFEDDDYSMRVRQAGYRTVCAEDAYVHHFGQAAFKLLLASGEYQDIWDANQRHYEKKWGKWQAHQTRRSE